MFRLLAVARRLAVGDFAPCSHSHARVASLCDTARSIVPVLFCKLYYIAKSKIAKYFSLRQGGFKFRDGSI
ncbi:hypothetical protein [Campylobacter curvus]|uniref:hypothetical protein n=1 Tax=Campylobacter curvus TaxID=200 RepID=UPI0014702B3E|nr:hypothetical protein [Campylobacter curvus]